MLNGADENIVFILQLSMHQWKKTAIGKITEFFFWKKFDSAELIEHFKADDEETVYLLINTCRHENIKEDIELWQMN